MSAIEDRLAAIEAKVTALEAAQLTRAARDAERLIRDAVSGAFKDGCSETSVTAGSEQRVDLDAFSKAFEAGAGPIRAAVEQVTSEFRSRRGVVSP